MATESPVDDREVNDAVQVIITRLLNYDDDTKGRIFRTAQTFFGLETPPQMRRPVMSSEIPPTPGPRSFSFSDREELSPKEFIVQKQPKTDLERVACLAFYLTHYRDTPHFKTLDISKLNTEAAHAKFSNPAASVSNAAASGLFVSAGKGAKQISPMGERFVDALPNHSAAKAVMSSMKPRRTRKKTNGKSK